MWRARRSHGLLDRKLFDETFRIARLRNIRINYELNHEWEQLCREIWVRLAEIPPQTRLRRDVIFHVDEAVRAICTALKMSPRHICEAHRISYDRHVKMIVGRRPVYPKKRLLTRLVLIYPSICESFAFTPK